MQPLSILCHSFQDIDKYTVGFPRGDGRGQTNIFRTVKHCLPGPVRKIILKFFEIEIFFHPEMWLTDSSSC